MRKLFFAASLLLASAVSAADVEHSFQRTVARGSIRRILIDIPTASFTIRNGSANQLALSAIVSRDFDGAEEKVWAQKVVNDTTVEFYVNGPDAVIRRKFGPNAQSWRAQKFSGLDLRLDLPAGVDIQFETTAGEVDMAGSFGNIDLDMRAGEIDLRMPRAMVRELNASCRIGEVRTNVGTELITKEGLFPGATRFLNPAGRSRVNVHVTAGEIDVTLTQ
jgi:hypothetical protein